MRKIMIAGEKYIKEGVEKVKWIEAGVIMQKDGKEFVLLHKHINLAAFESQPGKTSVICSVFDDSQSQQPQQGQSHYAQPQGQQAPQQQGGYAGQGQQQAPQQQQQNQYQQGQPVYDQDGNIIPV